jgi:ribosomal protein S8
MLTDPISDMLTRIRNAVMARHDRVTLPARASSAKWPRSW